MKVLRKLSVIIAIVVMLFGVSSVQAFATTTTQDGLEVTFTTDKEEYNKGEQIVTTLTVKNTNNTTVTNVSLENIIPDGYKLSDKSEATKQVEKLNTGETVTLVVTYVANVEKDGNLKSEESKNSNINAGTVNTGDSITIIALLIGSIILIIVSLKSKKGRKLLSLILTVLIISGTSAVLSFKANATESKIKSIETKTNVKVQNKDINLSAKVSYEIVSNEGESYYTVTFESNGGSDVESVSVKYGETISAPKTPTKEGYVFAGWYMSNDFDEMFLFDDDIITTNTTLYANWISDDPDSIRAKYVLDNIIIKYQQGDTAYNVTKDITLPEKIEDIDISWSSSNTEIVEVNGKVTRSNSEDTNVVLTATVTVGEKTFSKTFPIKVIGKKDELASDENYTVVDIQNMNKDEELDITYNDDRTQVISIEGKYSELNVNNSEDALSVVQGIRTIVGLSNVYDELELFSTTSDEYGSVYKFNQIFKGYEVDGYRLVVSVNENGVTAALKSKFVYVY